MFSNDITTCVPYKTTQHTVQVHANSLYCKHDIFFILTLFLCPGLINFLFCSVCLLAVCRGKAHFILNELKSKVDPPVRQQVLGCFWSPVYIVTSCVKMFFCHLGNVWEANNDSVQMHECDFALGG